MNPSLAATYFALRLLNYAGCHSEVARWESGLGSFVKSCWQDEAGGFSSVPGATATVVHSRIGLALCQELNISRWPYKTRLLDFLAQCRINGGYGFKPDDAPNAYATRGALAIITEWCRLSPKARAEASYAVRDLFFDDPAKAFRCVALGSQVVGLPSAERATDQMPQAFCYN